MTTFVPYYNETVSGTWKVLANKDNIYVGAGIQLGSTTSAVVLGTSNNLMMFEGTLAGEYGVGVGSTSQVTIGSSGTVMGSIIGMYAYGAGSTVWNEGKIFGGGVAIGDSGGTFAEIHNSGTIFSGAGSYAGKNAAILLLSSASTFIENSGTIRVQQSGSLAIDAGTSSGAQTVVNTGHITGGVMLGGGNDSYSGASGRHVSGNLDGGAGNDTISGGADADRILGSVGNDVLSGGGGADMIWGGGGNDRLTGGASADVFVFNSAVGAANADTITDFKKVDDTIQLENAIFTALGTGKLASSQFYAHSGATKAHDSDDRIIYNKTNGKLFYDDDGKGGHAAVHFATLSGHPSIAAADFFII